MKVVFLDRDGVINQFPGNGNYVTKVKDFHFLPGALEAIKGLTQEGYIIFVVSNQAGVGKGVFSRDKLHRITKKMLTRVKRHGGNVKKVLYCIHRTEDGCACRKPNIGLIQKAMATLKKTIRTAKKAYFIGDTKSDMITGHNAGCKTIFVLSGRETRHHLRGWPVKPDYIAKDLLEASQIINNNRAKKTTATRKVKKRQALRK